MPRGQHDPTANAQHDEHDPANVGVLNRRDIDAAADEGPSLIRPRNLTPTIDLSRPEDAPDLPGGEWSKRHLLQFLARQPYDTVFIPKENWEPKGVPTFQTVGYLGHWFSIKKGEATDVPVQIAAIIKQSQEDYPTMQSKSIRRQLTDLNDLPRQSLGSRGSVEGIEVAV